MQNVEIKVLEGGKKVQITIDTTKNYGPSSSGKSEIVATTGGNIVIDGTDGLTLGLNAYRRAK